MSPIRLSGGDMLGCSAAPDAASGNGLPQCEQKTQASPISLINIGLFLLMSSFITNIGSRNRGDGPDGRHGSKYPLFFSSRNCHFSLLRDCSYPTVRCGHHLEQAASATWPGFRSFWIVLGGHVDVRTGTGWSCGQNLFAQLVAAGPCRLGPAVQSRGWLQS